ncbi:hypothetical protein [Kitasatospora sp. NPDC094016]|uniref:hypothetical protein n=1 Tax=Kitasatospora sp. NPDC094016 TaxID=3154986 RepID=UPI003328DB5B
MTKVPFVYPERPDFEQARKDAADAAAADLGAIADPLTRARRAVAIIDQADTDIPKNKKRRDRAALSLWAYEGHRTRGLEQSMGCTRMQWSRIQASAFGWKITGAATPPPTPKAGPDRVEAARTAGIAELPVDKALNEVAKYGVLTVRAQARRDEAVKFRDAAILVLSRPPYSMGHEAIVAEVGMSATGTVGERTKRAADEAKQADAEAAHQEAVRLVAAELDGLAPADRARRAAEIARTAQQEITEYTQLRHQAALSLWAYGGGRIRSMPRALGYTREQWDEVWTAALGQHHAAGQDAPEPPVNGPTRARIAHEHGIAQLPVDKALTDLQTYRLLIEQARARHDEAQRAGKTTDQV